MRHEKHNDPGARVFIAGLRSFEIVYLPGTGQIVSRLPTPAVKPAPAPQVRAGAAKGDPRN